MKAASGNPRMLALALLASVLDDGKNLGEAEIEDASTDDRDRAFSRHLAFGVLRWLTALEWLADQLLKRPLRKKDRDIHRLILLGLFQLWQDRTAPHAAVHETAECARVLDKKWAVPLVNAVLRRFQREASEILEGLALRDERLAHPEWFLEALKKDWPDDWREIVMHNNEPGPLWLRLGRGADIRWARDRIQAAGVTVTAHSAVPGAVRIDPPTAVARLAGFSEGRISVQDPAAQLAAGLLGAQSGHRVLDACAAPGGKTGHILEQAPDVRLTALDRSETRLQKVRETIGRLGFGANREIRLITADAAEPEAWWDGVPYQRILLDAPCTATGVIRRHPEIKWLRKPGQVAGAAEQQARLLRRLWPLLETGGILLYATCSVLKVENSYQIQGFIAQHTDAELVGIDASWGTDLGFGRQILPGELEMDGFFYARLRKTP
jgi:16S rRNA (cytosine967-C5)-methyltransferase